MSLVWRRLPPKTSLRMTLVPGWMSISLRILAERFLGCIFMRVEARGTVKIVRSGFFFAEALRAFKRTRTHNQGIGKSDEALEHCIVDGVLEPVGVRVSLVFWNAKDVDKEHAQGFMPKKDALCGLASFWRERRVSVGIVGDQPLPLEPP